MHHEVELGLVMGQQLRDLDAGDDAKAMSAIRCYVLAVDLTARNMQNQAKKAGLPWSMAKGFDTFCPISNPFEPSRFPPAQLSGQSFPDPYSGYLFLNASGRTRQADSVGLMLFNIPRILSEISKVMTLEPNDLVLTGTPKGVGALVSGDSIKIGCRIGDENGPDIEEAKSSWEVKDSDGSFQFVE
ncbi:MAG: hypothetical protein M1831_000455 [Alyxoria varia]|nr:MAG: hypothetical protein M1831_000455 [Alyxoria varia]